MSESAKINKNPKKHAIYYFNFYHTIITSCFIIIQPFSYFFPQAEIQPESLTQFDQISIQKDPFIKMAELSDILILVIPLFFVIIIYLQMCRTRTTKNSSSLKKEVKQLSSLPIVSITANDILLSKDKKIIDEGTKLALEMLAKHACIFLFVIVNDQEEADNLLEPISKEFEGLVDPDNILFTQTQLGRASMARALESLAHIDFDPEVVHQTSIFINSVLIASPEVDSQYAKWKGTTFKEFITRGSTDFFASFRH